MITVIKRNGLKVNFEPEKVILAITKAYDGEEVPKYAYSIVKKIKKLAKQCDNVIHVEDIQNLIEIHLMKRDKKTAREFIRYRYKREVARNSSTEFIDAMTDKLMAKNVENSNANVDEHSFGGRVGEASNEMMKQYALDHCMSDLSRKNHLNNEIYIHDLAAYAVGMHNCAARETKFCTTYEGVKSFKDYNDGDIITVITPYGRNQKAIVKKYGRQKLNKITFSFAGQRFVSERFTANHRWLLADGSITSSLKVGDKLFKAPINIREFNWDNASEEEKYYWCLGFVLGDGTEAYRWSHGVKKEDIKFVRMRLCGDKIKYASRFSQLKHSIKKLENGDLYLTFSSTIGFRKLFPDLTQMTRQEKLALFDGLYCADGQYSGSRKSIMVTDKQLASFIENEVPALGWHILNISDKTGEQTNYKKRGFTKEYTFIGDNNKYYWTVVDIQEDCEEEVWCLEVENDNSFVLPNGITTGNCLSMPLDDLLAKGFNTRQVDIRPAGSINTAFQLVAVLFQLQSLMQFGR